MRILYFTRDYTPHDHRFLAALAETEHEIFFLQLERRGHQQEDREPPSGVQLLQWAGGQGPARLTSAPRLLYSLRRLIARLKPDLIHAGPVQSVALLAALSGFRPLVTMSWGSDLLLDAEKDWRYRWATRFVLKRSAVLVGDCDAVRQKAIGFGFPEERILTFPWGVDLTHFSPGQEEGLRASAGWDDAFVLLHTRTWAPLYGVDVLAQAFVQAAKQLPQLRLFLLGTGPLAAQVRRTFADGGVLDRVHFSGQVSFAELPRYYRAADLYLSASYSDGSSVSLLEALACGTLVLVSDIPGNREWVTPGALGWTFPPGDTDALAQAIVEAVEQRAALPAMARAARELAEQRADWTQNFPTLLRAYELAMEVADRKSSHRTPITIY